MRIITKEEFDEAVRQVAGQVFDPFGDGEVHDFSMEIVDLVDEGRQDEAKDRLKRRTYHNVLFKHPFGDGPLDDQPPIVHGCLVQHRDGTLSLDYREEHLSLHRHSAEETVQEMGMAAFYSAVKDEVWSLARATCSDARDMDDPDIGAQA